MHRTLPLLLAAVSAHADVVRIELTPTDLASANTAFFTVRPTADPALFFGVDYAQQVRRVDFNTAPDGVLTEGASLTTQYASYGVTMNDIRISADIYGGNNYGPGFAAEDDAAQIYTFSAPVVAVGIVNTSPDRDLVQFFSGPGATGELLFEFRDQEGLPLNFNIDRFVGGTAQAGTTIRSFVISNASGNMELDELIFAFATCPADFNASGSLDFFDVAAFINAFTNAQPAADFNADGVFNFFDVSAFITAFTAGCP
jgi:hypothetical protein